MDANNQNKMEVNELYRVEDENRQKYYARIQEAKGCADIEEYKEALRQLYFEEDIFKAKKSKELLEKNLQELNPYLHYNEQTELILKNIAKVFLIELFEEAIEVREKLPHKRDIDEDVLEEAFRRLRKK